MLYQDCNQTTIKVMHKKFIILALAVTTAISGLGALGTVRAVEPTRGLAVRAVEPSHIQEDKEGIQKSHDVRILKSNAPCSFSKGFR